MIQSVKEIDIGGQPVTEFSEEGVSMHGERQFLVRTDGASASFGALSHEKIPKIGSPWNKEHPDLQCTRLLIKPDIDVHQIFWVTAEYRALGKLD